MTARAAKCTFLEGGCVKTKTDICECPDFENCSVWYEILMSKNLCPLMLKAGYTPDNGTSKCTLPTNLRPTEERCFEKNTCLPMSKNPKIVESIRI